MNDHLLNNPTPETEFELTGMRDYMLKTSSGYAPKGKYLFEIKSAKWQDKKSGSGKTAVFETWIVEPKAFGIPITIYHPAPTGENAEHGVNFLKQLLYSSCTVAGTTEKLIANDKIVIRLKDFVGRKFAASIRDSHDNKGNIRSEIENYLDFNSIKDNLGPDATTAQEPAQAGKIPQVIDSSKVNGTGGHAPAPVPASTPAPAAAYTF